jgi:hypothetical protein
MWDRAIRMKFTSASRRVSPSQFNEFGHGSLDTEIRKSGDVTTQVGIGRGAIRELGRGHGGAEGSGGEPTGACR